MANEIKLRWGEYIGGMRISQGDHSIRGFLFIEQKRVGTKEPSITSKAGISTTGMSTLSIKIPNNLLFCYN